MHQNIRHEGRWNYLPEYEPEKLFDQNKHEFSVLIHRGFLFFSI
jgi:hypothetical protein